MTKWIEIGEANEVCPGERRCTTAGGIPVAVFNIDGKLHAIQNICPHAGLPLADGDLNGKALTCPFHGYTYNVETGKNIDYADDIPVTLYPVKVEDGKLFVDLTPTPG